MIMTPLRPLYVPPGDHSQTTPPPPEPRRRRSTPTHPRLADVLGACRRSPAPREAVEKTVKLSSGSSCSGQPLSPQGSPSSRAAELGWLRGSPTPGILPNTPLQAAGSPGALTSTDEFSSHLLKFLFLLLPYPLTSREDCRHLSPHGSIVRIVLTVRDLAASLMPVERKVVRLRWEELPCGRTPAPRLDETQLCLGRASPFTGGTLWIP